MIYLKQSTASQEIPLGYFLDSSDGDTEETGLTIANTDIKIWKTGATTLANKNSGGATHISNGVYYCTLDATDTNTLGPMVIFVHVSGALAIRVECCVLPSNIYDSWIAGSDYQQVDLLQIGGDTQSATDIKDFADAGYDPATNKVEGVKLVDTTTTNSDMRGTDNAALAATALSNVTWTDARAGYLDNINGHTAQTGDSFARIGANGASLSAIPYNSAWDSEIQSEVNDALVAINLDHLCAVATGAADMTSEVVDNSILSRILANGNTSNFDPSTDGLQLIRDRGDAAWTTATTVDLNADQSGVTIGTVTTNTDMRGTDNAALASVCTEARLSELAAANMPTDIANVKSDTAAILLDTGTDGVVVASGSKTGYALSAAGIDSILDEVLTDLTDGDIDSGQSITLRKAMRSVFNRLFRKVTQTATVQTVYNDSSAAMADMAVSDDGTTQTKDTT